MLGYSYNIIAVLVFVYGVLVGSFTNVLIYRIERGIGVAKGRSFCPNCGYTLAWYDLVPVLSYIFLLGRCRKCKTSISIRYPLVEMLSGVAYFIVFIRYGLTLTTLCYCIATTCLIALSFIDADEMYIPDTFPLVIGAMGVIMAFDPTSELVWWERALGFISVSGIFFLIALLSGGRAMGGGDIKLMAGAGICLGYQMCLLSLFIGALIGTIYYLGLKIFKGRKMSGVAPFGPLLAAGIYISAIWGEGILAWYLGMFI